MGKKPSQDTVHIGLTIQQRTRSAELLAHILADQSVLRTKTQNCHWNVEGPEFPMLHEFFEVQYNALTAAIDETAERIRMLGLPAPGSMAQFLKLSDLKETSSALCDGTEALRMLLDDNEQCARELRKAVDAFDDNGDTGNADYATQLLQAHEKVAWMLRSTLAGKR